MLNHWEVCLEADASARYIPFDGNGASAKGQHSVRLGTEQNVDYAKQWALDIFPLARVVAVWEINILGDRLRQIE